MLKVRGEKKKYLRGALEGAHFPSHEKSNYLGTMLQENFAHIKFET
jgi:hypothetical protein